MKKVKEQSEIEAERNQEIDQLTEQITQFCKLLKTAKPELFPARELAIRIIDKEPYGKSEM